jgi:hypothetical protein
MADKIFAWLNPEGQTERGSATRSNENLQSSQRVTEHVRLAKLLRVTDPRSVFLTIGQR